MKRIGIFLIEVYQFFLSPDHSFWARALGRQHCKFYPTCSDYSKQAIEKHGFFRGIRLAFRRVIRCRPGVKGGVDLVPDKIKEK